MYLISQLALTHLRWPLPILPSLPLPFPYSPPSLTTHLSSLSSHNPPQTNPTPTPKLTFSLLPHTVPTRQRVLPSIRPLPRRCPLGTQRAPDQRETWSRCPDRLGCLSMCIGSQGTNGSLNEWARWNGIDGDVWDVFT
jgi:hypothetical protein